MKNKIFSLRQRAALWEARAEIAEKDAVTLAERRYSDMDEAIGLFAKAERDRLDWQKSQAWGEKAETIRLRGEARIEQAILNRVAKAASIKARTLAAGAATAKKFRDRAARLLAEAQQLEATQ